MNSISIVRFFCWCLPLVLMACGEGESTANVNEQEEHKVWLENEIYVNEELIVWLMASEDSCTQVIEHCDSAIVAKQAEIVEVEHMQYPGLDSLKEELKALLEQKTATEIENSLNKAMVLDLAAKNDSMQILLKDYE